MSTRSAAVSRCEWAEGSPLLRRYHDREWGVPVHRDRKHFEFLILDAFQAGLSWNLVLRKRPALRRAFANFNPRRISQFTGREVRRLMADPGIIRNRGKIEATIVNAQRFLDVQREFGSFDRYIWSFVSDRPILSRHRQMSDLPAKTPVAETMSRDLKLRGFKFVGPTICYAYMQAAGLVNDHTLGCFRYGQVAPRVTSRYTGSSRGRSRSPTA
ncbi:MAG TPA: DNA-3-methyladenine glycosylase I [bacterium]|nr:DNA-3-methyladenine glycosylase I [bacterium]